uniref:Uncharacterized protein n=1 Tax=Anguilla anguilla TaxID=7936 RepID=A0A0E9UNL5_ANGAN
MPVLFQTAVRQSVDWLVLGQEHALCLKP